MTVWINEMSFEVFTSPFISLKLKDCEGKKNTDLGSWFVGVCSLINKLTLDRGYAEGIL